MRTTGGLYAGNGPLERRKLLVVKSAGVYSVFPEVVISRLVAAAVFCRVMPELRDFARP